jgi:hypothetical protein
VERHAQTQPIRHIHCYGWGTQDHLPGIQRLDSGLDLANTLQKLILITGRHPGTLACGDVGLCLADHQQILAAEEQVDVMSLLLGST